MQKNFSRSISNFFQEASRFQLSTEWTFLAKTKTQQRHSSRSVSAYTYPRAKKTRQKQQSTNAEYVASNIFISDNLKNGRKNDYFLRSFRIVSAC